MADPRKKCGSIYVKKDGKNVCFELFEALLWPEQPEAAEGLYRVRVNGEWLQVQGRKYSFMTYQAAELIAFREATAGDALSLLEQAPPQLKPLQRVRWTPSDDFTQPILAKVAHEPFQGMDGLWRVPIYYWKRGRMVPGPQVLCDELQVL